MLEIGKEQSGHQKPSNTDSPSSDFQRLETQLGFARQVERGLVIVVADVEVAKTVSLSSKLLRLTSIPPLCNVAKRGQQKVG